MWKTIKDRATFSGGFKSFIIAKVLMFRHLKVGMKKKIQTHWSTGFSRTPR